MSNEIMCKIPVQERTDVCCVCGKPLETVEGRCYYFYDDCVKIAQTEYHQCSECEIRFKTFRELEAEESQLSERVGRHVEIERFALLDPARDRKEAKRLNKGRLKELEPIHKILVAEATGEYHTARGEIERLLEKNENADKYRLFLLLRRICKASDALDTFRSDFGLYSAGLTEEQIAAIKAADAADVNAVSAAAFSKISLRTEREKDGTVQLAETEPEAEADDGTIGAEIQTVEAEAEENEQVVEEEPIEEGTVEEGPVEETVEVMWDAAEDTPVQEAAPRVVYIDLSRFAPYMKF